jgi:hypothetical protein
LCEDDGAIVRAASGASKAVTQTQIAESFSTNGTETSVPAGGPGG